METFWSGYLSSSLMASSICVGKADTKKLHFWVDYYRHVFQGGKGYLAPVGFLLPFPVRLTKNVSTRWKLCFPLVCMFFHVFESFECHLVWNGAYFSLLFGIK